MFSFRAFCLCLVVFRFGAGSQNSVFAGLWIDAPALREEDVLPPVGQTFKEFVMKEKIALDQSRLMGFRVQPKHVGDGVRAVSAKLGPKVGGKKPG